MQASLRKKLSELQESRSNPKNRTTKRTADVGESRTILTTKKRCEKVNKKEQQNNCPENAVPAQSKTLGMDVDKNSEEINAQPTASSGSSASHSYKLDFSDFDFLEDFKNKSWVEICEEEERKKEESVRKEIEEKSNASVLSFDDFEFPDDFKNKSWVEIVEEEERKREEALAAKNAEKEKASSQASIVSSKLKRSAPSTPSRESRSGSSVLPTPKKRWAEPGKGWCWQEQTLIRREKEIQRMKERPTYIRYLADVPKSVRKKNVHPRTPNKFLNWSRRSWDKQIKIWKLAIYEWAGESPTPSVFGSYCSSECGDDLSRASSTEPTTAKRIKCENASSDSSFGDVQIKNEVNIPASADNMASLFGFCDLDTMRDAPTLIQSIGDESTLKAVPCSSGPVTRAKSYAAAVEAGKTTKGPTDFSHLIPKQSSHNQSGLADKEGGEKKKRGHIK